MPQKGFFLLINLSKYFLSVLTVFLLLMGNASSADQYKVELLDENNGFASSIIFSIVQDKYGFLWFGTAYDGVMRYDGQRVVRYLHDPNDKNSLAHNNAGNLTIDKNNNLWIGSWGGGLSILNIQTDIFRHYAFDETQTNSISSTRIQNIFEDQQGDIWLGTGDRGLNKFNHNQQDFTQFAYHKFGEQLQKKIPNGRVWDIAQTAPDTLWIGTSVGLNRFNTVSNTFQRFDSNLKPINPEHKKIRQIVVTEGNSLLLGTDDGVLLFEPQTQTFTTLDIDGYPNIGPINSMIKTNFNQYWVTSNHGVFSFTVDDLTLKKVNLGVNDQCSQTLFQDKQGIIWLSCEGVGVYKIIKQNRFKLYAHSLVKSAYSLLSTDDDTLLIGTAQHGIQQWNPATNQLIALDSNADGSSPPVVLRMTNTSQGDIWFNNSHSLFKLNKEGTRQQILAPDTLTKAKYFKQFKHIMTDHRDNIWVGTSFGLFVIRDTNGEIEYIPLEASMGPSASTKLYQDVQNRIWIGRTDGLFLWNDNTKEAKHFRLPDNQESLSVTNNYIYAIHLDSQQRLWVSTSKGLYLLDEKTAEFTLYFNVSSNNLVPRFIKEDASGYLWLFSPIGVSRLNPEDGKIQHFNKSDGLSASRLFFSDVAQKSDGTVFFSSREGVHYFDPLAVKQQPLNAATLVTNFELLGTAKQGQITHHGSTNISLAYDQNYFKFEFVTLDMLHAQQIQYEYKLQGFDNNWIKNGSNNSAVYTNLSGGEYLFKVRAAINNDLYYEDELQVRVYIATPFWLQWWMFVLYAALILLSIVYYIQRQKKAVLRLEKQVLEKTAAIALKSDKLEVANKIKSQFLANMSHEIRTPLTTVIGQAEAIIHGDVETADIFKEVQVIHNSGLHLLALLNDILDLSKIEENKFELELHAQDIHALLENINNMFLIQAINKGLSFKLTKHLPAVFNIKIDSLRLKQILINLCSNAIKFTAKGTVTLDIVTENNQLIFTITDTGIGMDTQQTKLAFESFTQGDASISRRFGGTGLGLSLSNALAKLMGGNISVNSRLDEGSVFTLLIPVEIISTPDKLMTKTSKQAVSIPENLFSGTVLLAEDHSENRRLIARLLTKLGLTVYTAVDGLQAIDLVLKHNPDIILLDIQMPRMDGIQAYKTLREQGYNQPILALTANAMSHEVEQYLTLGFNGHLCKPLNRKNLIATLVKYFPSQTPAIENEADKVLSSVDMSDLVMQFKASLANEKDQLTLHANHQDMHSIAKQSHRLIGASQLFGFSKLADIAAELETCVKTNNLEKADTLVQNLLHEMTILTP